MAKSPKFCKRDGLKAEIAKHDKAVVVFRQKGCPGCPPWEKRLRKELAKSRTKIITVPLGENKDDCETLADGFKVKATPTTAVFKKGRMVGRPFTPEDPGVYDKTARKLHKYLGK